MKSWQIFVAVCLSALASCAHTPMDSSVKTDNFWFIFLETGKKTPNDKELVTKMQRGHIKNFERLFAERKLFAAGPLQDPTGLKRGIVIVNAPSRDELTSYFQPDEYVRDGYMTLNATRCVVHKGLATEGIDTTGIEEVRIVQLMRPANAGDARTNQAFLQSLLDKGTVSAWYTIESGPVAEILFAKTTDTKMLRETFAQYPASQPFSGVEIWGQWLSKGVVK